MLRAEEAAKELLFSLGNEELIYQDGYKSAELGLGVEKLLNGQHTPDLSVAQLLKAPSGGAAHAGSAASDNGYLAGQATIQGFGTCAHDISPETGSDAFAAVDDQRMPGHESGHVRR
jgi:hypothetical protein